MEKTPKILYNEIGPNGIPYKKGEWKNFAIQNEKEVKGFFGEYRFLSNFWPAKVFLDGVEYQSVEIAYQASKWRIEDRDFFQHCTELQSIEYNRERQPNAYSDEEWRNKKVEIMLNLLRQKFDPALNPENHQKLLATGDRYLEEMNWWGDNYWGTDKDGLGQNMLGKMLMEIRDKS